jgi:LysM repeat protein
MCFQNQLDGMNCAAMTTIDPGLRRHELDRLLRKSARLTAVGAYATAVVLGFVAVRPAFEHRPAVPTVAPRRAPARVDVVRKGENVATFAARHGLDLGELLALNPQVDSLKAKPGTKLRIG